MKKRPLQHQTNDFNGRSEGESTVNTYNIDRRKRNRQRLGGKGLSLEAFTNAKTKRTDYNPAIIIITMFSTVPEKQREFYKNAKCVSKYKRSLKQLHASENHTSPAAQFPEGGTDDHEIRNNTKMKNKFKNKNRNSLQSAREEYEKKLEEQEKARMERESIMQAKKEERERAEARRKVLREKMFKKTRSGQPIMKYRIEHLLEGLQDSKN
ncbi:thyroid transcription factor 1-associated protein 26 [Cinnamomum micranthum f. kanehirae]|uniref:Thyroid transcription factor 1-associated protein 26 n=1 Tax=Cinnamomum micranthum f. kanehirae TaxID=337451 RepID=A0A443PX40_9MAGN|nr:thyroid transcription factor 1-associated protein 26 [Cinnamomum micranthum f. kanehirae]